MEPVFTFNVGERPREQDYRCHSAMSPVLASAITSADGEITIDAKVLAPKLRLSVEALKAEMRKGNVTSVAETGINEDAGRTRVTFRYRTRTLIVVVEPDGTVLEKSR